MIAIAAIRYFTRDYLLSFRYFAPLTVYLFAVAFVYGVVPNPIMPSFSFTSTVLFMVSAWLALGYIDLEPESQQIITSLRLRGMAAYYGLKIVPLAVLAIVLSVLTVVYPTFGDKFVRTPNAEELWTAMACHVGLAEMGCAAGILFTRKWFPKWYTAWGGLVLFIVVSLAGSRIIDSVPPAIGILEWVLPPLFRTMEMLNEYESATASERFLGMAMPCVYALALMVLYIIGMSRKKM